jgi:hypothetical protein
VNKNIVHKDIASGNGGKHAKKNEKDEEGE